MKIRELNVADSLISKMITHVVENFGLYENIDEWAANAELPRGHSYTSIDDRVASMANPTEMVGELEILATSRTLQRQIQLTKISEKKRQTTSKQQRMRIEESNQNDNSESDLCIASDVTRSARRQWSDAGSAKHGSIKVAPVEFHRIFDATSASS